MPDRAVVELVSVDGYPDLLAVHIDGYSMGLYLRRMQRSGEVVYQPREMPDLGVYRDPIEAVRGALSVAFRAYIGDESCLTAPWWMNAANLVPSELVLMDRGITGQHQFLIPEGSAPVLIAEKFSSLNPAPSSP